MFKRGITLGELIATATLLIGTVLSFWITTNVRLTALEIHREQDYKNWESSFKENNNSFQNINLKLERLNDGQNDIKVILQNKQDRK